ncbi:uncharacterized protein LOC129316563 [Prosopis cineraria]|uniref:uncharacterized protein LOC129316563 n=1 Tax=Prosopis cineraria TaxID=364024 RepID=UPI00240F8AC9|nr:uncharacterized protein LOC129316563 [Prosopis cineraria]
MYIVVHVLFYLYTAKSRRTECRAFASVSVFFLLISHRIGFNLFIALLVYSPLSFFFFLLSCWTCVCVCLESSNPSSFRSDILLLLPVKQLSRTHLLSFSVVNELRSGCYYCTSIWGKMLMLSSSPLDSKAE